MLIGSKTKGNWTGIGSVDLDLVVFVEIDWWIWMMLDFTSVYILFLHGCNVSSLMNACMRQDRSPVSWTDDGPCDRPDGERIAALRESLT